ncbi:MAG: RNA-directed DNA polymerase [Caldilinea sp.]|nr:RNA-directed DNA polymerase [Caldilinea sp.]
MTFDASRITYHALRITHHHAILRAKLARTIADDAVLALVDHILASGAGVLAPVYVPEWYPGDDLLAPLRPRGLPIGNLTSQTWANFYLNSLDHFVKRELKCPAYVRYCDDFLLFGDDKAALHEWKSAVQDHLAGLRLSLRLEITGFDAEAQRCRGSQRQNDNEAGLFSAFFSAPLRLCVKIANFQMDSHRQARHALHLWDRETHLECRVNHPRCPSIRYRLSSCRPNCTARVASAGWCRWRAPSRAWHTTSTVPLR